MAKRKNRSKRSASSLPKGLPVRKGGDTNPFEISHRQKRSKFQVANRGNPPPAKTSKLAQALQKRKNAVKQAFQDAKKANVFVDKRIGEYDDQMTAEQQNLARLVRERSRRSKRNTKYSLDDNDNDVLTHRGRAVDPENPSAVILSDDEDEIGNLDAADTAMHFGGAGMTEREESMYGSSGNATGRMSQLYSQRKTDLDDLIARRKDMKAAKMQAREVQTDTFEAMDRSFQELKDVLQFRDKEQELRKRLKEKREGTLSEADQEMADWDKEMKEYLHADRKVKATDRTKTPEEIAKEEAERLHELETRRLARMNGDFDDDDFSDVSDDEDNKRSKKRRKRPPANHDNPEALSDSDDESDDENKITTRFTADGLVKVNKEGVVVGKVGDEEPEKKASGGEVWLASEISRPLAVGERVEASYRATEQFDGNESWFSGVISRVNGKEGTYYVEYDDGDFEDGVQAQHIRVTTKSEEEIEKETEDKEKEAVLKRKRKKAKDKARTDMPFVFEVPTTLEALHEMIGNHAKTGADASLIVKRIHSANSVRLDKRNTEKMQNFYDVVLRRFIAVGDAISTSGDGGSELGRWKQLDSLTETMYDMAQDSPEIASAVWSRRLGFLQNAHAKRLRDAEFMSPDDDDEEEFSAWPSTGVVLALRAVGHIFPATDLRHTVMTPTLLLLGQMIGYTPVWTKFDAVLGTMCAGLLIEYTKDASRVSPEAHSFLASIIRTYASSEKDRRIGYTLPSFEGTSGDIRDLREEVVAFKATEAPKLVLENGHMEGPDMAAALLNSALQLVEVSATNLAGSLATAEKELFAEITASVLALNPKSKTDPLPPVLQKKIASVAATLSSFHTPSRTPVQRCLVSSVKSIKSLAPRMEDPTKYSLSRDKGKSATQAAADRTRREYKREHKAVARELRMDAAMVEGERRREQDKKDSAAKAKRQKAFAWLEGEQAAVNQQVRQGGGVLQGGGMGAARAKAATAKLGIKKGGRIK